jgi:hypothetical protein
MSPQMEAVVWYYAFGKPIEKVEIEEKRSVRIIHEFIKAEDIIPPDGNRAVVFDARSVDPADAAVAGTDDDPDPMEPETS